MSLLNKPALGVLQLNMIDTRGGAARIAWNLHQAYRTHGVRSWMAVRTKFGLDDDDVFQIPNDSYNSIWSRFWLSVGEKIPPRSKSQAARTLRRKLFRVAHPRRAWNDWWGYEDFDYPSTWNLLNLPPQKPDLIHGHNLHRGYFDLRALPWLSHQVPLVLTLHDTWMLTGHCANSFDCERWLSGCGLCPYPDSYPPVKHDATAYNWHRKKTIFAKSKLYVATPSRWLMEMVKRSMLAPGVIEARVIHNGVDLTIFHPADQSNARRTLGLPLDASILLFAADYVRENTFKDYPTLRRAIDLLVEKAGARKIVCIALGDGQPTEQVECAGAVEIRFVPFQEDLKKIALYYHVADIYVHATRADNLPNTISEALACGKPVIASAVGGIPEQVKGLKNAPGVLGEYELEDATGLLVPAGNAASMAEAIEYLLTHNEQRLRLGENAAQDACLRFDLEQQSTQYLKWYEEILERF